MPTTAGRRQRSNEGPSVRRWVGLAERVVPLSLSSDPSAASIHSAGTTTLIGRFSLALKVKIRSGEPIQRMIKRFRKLCEKEGLIRDMKRNMRYEKPSEERRRRMRKAQRLVRSNHR